MLILSIIIVLPAVYFGCQYIPLKLIMLNIVAVQYPCET